MIRYILILAIQLMVIAFGATVSLKAKEHVPVGLIVRHYDLIRRPIWQSFIPLVIDENQFLIFTESGDSVTPESEIANADESWRI